MSVTTIYNKLRYDYMVDDLKGDVLKIYDMVMNNENSNYKEYSDKGMLESHQFNITFNQRELNNELAGRLSELKNKISKMIETLEEEM